MVTYLDLEKMENKNTDFMRYKLFRRGDVLPSPYTIDCRSTDEVADRDLIFAMAFYESKEWLFKGFKAAQPKSYEAIQKCSDLVMLSVQSFAGINKWKSSCRWYMECSERLVEVFVQAEVPNCSQLESSLENHPHYIKTKPYLGHRLASAYCSNIDNWGIPSTVISGLELNGLPRGFIRWSPLHVEMLHQVYGVTDPYNLPEAKSLSVLENEIDYIREHFFDDEKALDSKHILESFRVFFTTVNESGADDQIDHILVQGGKGSDNIRLNSDGDPILYRIKNNDWTNWQILDKPANAIDEYVAHTLTNPSIRFDFDPYCSPIE